MALISFLPPSPNTSHSHKRNKNTPKNHNKKKKKITPPPPPPPPPPDTKSSSSSWEQFKNLLSCKNTTSATPSVKRTNKYTKLSSTCSPSICVIRDVVRGNTRVTDHGSSSDSGSHNGSIPLPVHSGRSMRAPLPTSRGGMQLMKLSGCYECHAVDVHSLSRRYPRPRTLCPCTECGEVFSKSESLEQHQAIRHAVSELSPDDSSRNIVEIIFKSSWQRRNINPQIPFCSIERILKVRNTPRTISRFEDHRSAVISRCAAAGNTRRCAADGNELLRFLSAPVSCPLGLNGSTALCLPNHDPATTDHPPCRACTIIRHGFSEVVGPSGRIRTTASSGGAHEGSGRRAMLVCRVIAGRVKGKGEEEDGDDEVAAGSKLCYDSMAGDGGGLEELFVDNPRAILPCFVVIYKAS